MSPMMVVISSKTTPLYHFLTNICALIGGLFTVFSMANGEMACAIDACGQAANSFAMFCSIGVLDTIIKKLQGGPGL